MVVVDLLLATICFSLQPGDAQECHPVLIGPDTPRGEFTLNQRLTPEVGYGGDVLQFKVSSDGVFAIHRVYLLNPRERRADRLKSLDPKDRQISKGCVNVAPEVYKKLLDCCSRNGQLLIK